MNRVALSFVLISSLAVCSCHQKPEAPPTPPVPVNLYTVASQDVRYFDKYPGTTEALSQVNLLPQVQGSITGIFFTEGSFVKKGQKLYEIDRSLYEESYNQAEANLKVAQGTLVQSQEDADRYTYLNSQNAVAKQLYDHAMITLQNSKNSVKAAEEVVKTAQTNLSHSVIYAPFDGTIGFSQVKLGNVVTVGQTILNTISTNNPIAVDFLVNEKQLASFEVFEKSKQEEMDSLFTILLPNNSTYPYPGKISVIDRAVDPQTGSIRIRLVFPNPQNSLVAGMSCVVRVHNQETTPQMLIPGKAVIEQMGEYFVFVAKDSTVAPDPNAPQKPEADTASQKGPALRAFQVKVQLGQTIGPNVIVTSGISDGDKIIIDGIQSLHEGAKVSTGNGKPAPTNK